MEGIDFLKVVISEITGEVRVIADKNFIKMDKRKKSRLFRSNERFDNTVMD